MNALATASTVITGLATLGMFFVGYRTYRTNESFRKWTEEYNELLRHPKPVFIQGRLTFQRSPQKVRVELDISNPGDTSIFVQWLRLESWEGLQLLKHNDFRIDPRRFCVRPREIQQVVAETELKPDKGKFESFIKLGEIVRISIKLWYVTGTRTEMMSFDDLNMSWLNSSTAMIARPFLKIGSSPCR